MNGRFSSEFWTQLITLIVGGLAYSIISFSYMHNTFPTRAEKAEAERSLDKVEADVKRRLDRIESKIDQLIDGRRR